MATAAVSTQKMSNILEQIRQAESISEAIAIVKQIDALKNALESVGQFHNQAIVYAQLEAQALLRCVELGGITKLSGYHKWTAQWLSEMCEDERQHFIDMCADGLTIDQVYKREVRDGAKFKEVIDSLQRDSNFHVDIVKEDGIVSIKEFSETVRQKLCPFQKQLASDIIDGLRNRLRQCGAVGVGDEEQTYVMPTPENDSEVKAAIRLRYESICADFDSIMKIQRAAKISCSYRDFDDGSHWSYEDNPYVTHALMALAAIGAINDYEELYQAIVKTDLRKEIEYAKSHLRIARDDYIRLQYKSLQAQEGNE